MIQQSPRLVQPPSSAVSAVTKLPFAEIPGQSRLFLDYLAAPESLRHYYPNAVDSPAGLAAYREQVLASYVTDRAALCDVLREINLQSRAPEPTFDNIALLSRPDTVAIVTGQQAGLFTGPLYTIYKALSAIRLAQQLREQGASAVPVFWIASEDHDLDEIDHASLIESGDGLVEVRYRPGTARQGLSVGGIKFDSGITSAVEQLFDHLPRTEFSDGLKASLAEANTSDENYGSAFAKLLLAILGKFGLIVIDPMNPRIKELAKPVLRSAIEKSDEIVAAIRSRSSELEKNGYHAQVLVEEDYFPLFWHDDQGRRLALRSIGGDRFRVKGEKIDFTRDELLQLVDQEPHRFSPGVMLRPVVQDYLLPTLCYFGGGAEIAYFAQNSQAYRLFDRPVTPIFHRQSFTVIEPRERRNLGHFGWGLEDLFTGKDAAILNAAEKTLSPDLAQLFTDVEERINSELHRLDDRLSTLGEKLANRRRKILYHLSALRAKALRSEVQKDEIMRRRIDTLFDSLLPKGGLQERELNVLTFVNKYGPNFIDWIFDSFDLNDKDHRIIEL